MSKIQCTVPGCTKCLPLEAMWLPARGARETANGGKRVELADFPRFAVCGYHGHLLRKTGIRVYRYAEEVERERKAEEHRKDEEKAFSSFAERFVQKANASPYAKATGDKQGKGGGAPRKSFEGVGQGLSRCAKMDADKRSSAQPAEKPAKPNGASEAPTLALSS